MQKRTTREYCNVERFLSLSLLSGYHIMTSVLLPRNPPPPDGRPKGRNMCSVFRTRQRRPWTNFKSGYSATSVLLSSLLRAECRVRSAAKLHAGVVSILYSHICVGRYHIMAFVWRPATSSTPRLEHETCWTFNNIIVQPVCRSFQRKPSKEVFIRVPLFSCHLSCLLPHHFVPGMSRRRAVPLFCVTHSSKTTIGVPLLPMASSPRFLPHRTFPGSSRRRAGP